MATATVSFRMDEDTKRSMDEICKELGMTMTTAFTLFANKVVRERRIPFEVALDPFYGEENVAHLRRSIAQLDADLGTPHELIENDDD